MSAISRLPYPLGWLSLCVVIAKILIQKLWLAGIDWDDEVSLDVQHSWMELRETLPEIEKNRIPR